MRPFIVGERFGVGAVALFDREIENFEDSAGADDGFADVAEEGSDAIHRIEQVDEQEPVLEYRAGTEMPDDDFVDRDTT